MNSLKLQRMWVISFFCVFIYFFEHLKALFLTLRIIYNRKLDLVRILKLKSNIFSILYQIIGKNSNFYTLNQIDFNKIFVVVIISK